MISNKTSILSVFILITLFLSVSSIINHEDPTIIEVSTTLDTFTAASGSYEGGTLIYIKGTNFDPDPSLNSVLVGPYPCDLVADGSSENNLVCRTTPATNPDKTWKLPVKIECGSKKAPVTCADSNCQFTYLNSDTPAIEEIHPRTSYGNERVNIHGIHRITEPGDGRSPSASEIENILIGSTVCSLIDIDQEIQLSRNNRDNIICQVYQNQEAGEYQFSELVKPGYAKNLIRTKQTSYFTEQNYTQRIAPKITSMASHEGGDKGHKIKITGTGFSTDTSNYNCQISGETCTVIEASVNSVVVEVPEKDAGNTEFGKLAKDSGDSSTQELPYLGGLGIEMSVYERGSNYYSASGWFDYFQGSPSLTEIQTVTLSELSSTEIYESNNVKHAKGYFHAPADGTYRFGVVADDSFIMKMSTVPNNANPDNLQMVLEQQTYVSHRWNPYLKVNETQTHSNLTLTEGYYYFELVAIDYGGDSFFKVMVDMPEIHQYTTNPTWQVDEVRIRPSQYDAEEIVVTAFGDSGSFDLYYLEKVYGEWVKRSATFDIGDTDAEFKSALGGLPNINNYGPTVTRETLDANGDVTADPASIKGYKYTIVIDRYRPPADLPLKNESQIVSSGAASVTVERTVEHSPPVSGTFTMNIAGSNLEVDGSQSISYDVATWKLQSALNSLYDADEIDVAQVPSTYRENQIHFMIEYVGISGAAQAITLETSTLQGGKDNTMDSDYNIKREYSTRPLYSPVPADFLYTPSSLPALSLKVNSIPAICDDCSYEFNSAATPVASSASLSSNTLTISLTDPESLGFALTDITVELLGVTCVVDQSGTISNFDCDFPTNQDGSVALPAGSQKPRIHVKQIGFVNTASLTDVSVSLSISSLSPGTSSPGGGVQATLSGSGFPIDENGDYSISLCGNDVTNVKSVSNQEIVLVVPPEVTACSSNSEIVVNGQTASITFAYDSSSSPTVTGLSKTSSSPILKKELTVTGTNFGTTSNTQVFLYQDGQLQYELNALTVTSTEITCVLGGGKTGEYDVLVFVDGVGLSLASNSAKFSYKIVIDSVSPTSGSMGGGYNLTIEGKNFATDANSNNAFIGTAKNSICSVLEANDTHLICEVPRMLSDYSAGQTLEVVVTGRILEESICEGTCNFAFDDSVTNNVTVPSDLSFKYTNDVEIVGEGLSGATVTVGDIDCALIDSNNTYLKFKYPELEAGDYEIIINTASGHTYPEIMSSTPLQVWNTISATQGSQMGHVITVKGNGFPAKEDVTVWFVGSENVQLEIRSIKPSEVTFEVPKMGNDESGKINVTSSDKFKSFSYSYSASKTPQMTIEHDSAYTYNIVRTSTDASLDWAQFIFLDANDNPTSSKYEMTITEVSAPNYQIAPTDGYLAAGKYLVKVHSDSYGFAELNETTVTVDFATAPSTPTAVTSSFVGGKELTISGEGFLTADIENNDIRVCGLRAGIVSATESQITIEVPALITEVTDTLYSLGVEELVEGTAFGDNSDEANKGSDGTLNTVYSSQNEDCYVGIDFGENTEVDINKIRYAPNPEWHTASDYLDGALFEGSNDNSNWAEIFAIDTKNVHSGWNFWKKESGTHKYRYIRFKHNSQSSCEIADIEVHGIKYSTVSVASNANKDCDVTLADGTTFSNAVTYDHSATTIINSISPAFGTSAGGTEITLTGTNIGTAVIVEIDGVNCVVDSGAQSSTQVTCTTGVRPSAPEQGNSMKMTSDGSKVHIATDIFLYVDRWTDQETWGGQSVPREGDSVYVPKGMTLLVDDSTPILDTIIVEGKIMFADEKDMTLDAHYFIIREGEFQAGTEDEPYEHDLTITMHGGYYDKQLPIFGNKGIGCLNCKFNMHGKERTPTWTQVKSTITAGSVSFEVIEPVDWVAGEKIAIAATEFDHYETEEKVIQSVSANKTVITVTTPFEYKHYAAIETYDGEEFVMRAEVGLLTRNIKMQGNADSVADRYGSHLLLHGKEADGLVGKISYAQFTHCGQPGIIGRYCTHFHMAGEVPESFVRGIAVHHSFARVLTIHGTHYLLVEKNVGYHVEGHNIFVEDGIETYNVIQDNLMMSSIVSLTLLQSDVTVASYWITNPLNVVRRNHAAGGDFYGFWYEIKEHPDGPSATSDVCPEGMRIGESKDNVAHTNKRFGLRIFKLSARKNPCLPTKDQSLEDPYLANEAIENVFENYTLWRNEECGFLGEQLGYTTVKNIRTADSRKGGMQFHKTNYTKEYVTAEHCLVVGYSSGNAPADVDSTYNNARGVIASRTDGLKFTGIRFHNFGATMTPLQSCSECHTVKLWVTGGKTTYFKNITYTNILGNYIFWENWRRQIFIDEDGTLTKPLKDLISPAIPDQSKAVLTPNRPSLILDNHCYSVGDATWDDSIFCDETITLRGLLFTNAIPKIDFNAIDIKVYLLSDPNEDLTNSTDPEFSAEPMIKIKKSKDIANSWAMPFIMNQYYNVHWKWGIDFEHLAIAPNREWTDDDGIVLRFNYTDNREVFQIGSWYKQKFQLPYIIEAEDIIDPSDCENGDYYHDNITKYVYVCVSGRNKTINEWIDVNGLRCLNFCPEENVGVREDFQRNWDNATQWPNQRLPQEGENVTIPYEWNLLLNIDPPVLDQVIINGILTFDRMRDNTFQAHNIWVKQGIVRIGSESSPYIYQAKIILHGEKDDKFMVLDQGASGNKMLATTGGLQFYGNPPSTIWTRLTGTAEVGATSIEVIEADDWAVGDEIVIAPSYAGRKQFEKVEITAISGTTVTFTPALEYEHYGDTGITLSNDYGTLDARSAVGHLTRNIKIMPAADQHNWGCKVHIYAYLQIPEDLSLSDPIFRNGYAKFHGVEMDGCGQYDTTNAAIKIEKIGSDADTPNEEITQITSSAIHDCGGFCMFMDKFTNVTITNNVFFWARKFLVYVEEAISDYKFEENLLIGARKRDELDLSETKMVDDVACYEQYVAIDFAGDHQISVKNNLAQGSEGEGFVFPFTSCDLLDSYPFIDNTAGSCEVAFMYEKFNGQQCIGAAKMIGYASQIGLMANPPGVHTEIIYQDAFFTDNRRGITLRYAHEIDDNTCKLRNSYFAGFSRPDCENCYGNTKINYCRNGYAIRMFTSTITGQSFPLKKKATGHDVICTRQAYDMKAFLNNVTFENYLYDNPQLPYCNGMSVFRRHNGASDSVASHHLTNTKCINCETRSWAYFEKPSVSWRGWFGGCGELDCTGPNNYLIHDQDGTFMGEKGQLLSNNSIIGDNEDFCTYYSEMNGHVCTGEQLAVLEYESIAKDFNKRIMWPVSLKYDGGPWTSETNGWRQWQWDGPQPLNLRLARFVSVVKLHQHYNLSYTSTPPADSRFQIQQRILPSGNETDWVIIRIYYPLPNSIEVRVKTDSGSDQLVRPFPIREGVPEDLSDYTGQCGANNFHYENGTIEFVVNGKESCQVRVRLSSYVQLSTRIDIPIADFYSNDGETTFITNVCAFLGIDTGRLKIVGIRTGSTIIDAQVQTEPENVDETAEGNQTVEEDYIQMNDIEQRLSVGLANDQIDLGGPLLSYDTSVKIYNIDGSEYVPEGEEEILTEEDKLILIIVLAVTIPIFVISIGVAVYCYLKRRRAKIETIEVEEVNESSVQGGLGAEVTDDFSLKTKYKRDWRV